MDSSLNNSITSRIARLKGGDEAAAAEVWQTYFQRVMRLAQQKLPAKLRAVGPDDVAQEALFSLIRGAREGRFRQLDSRDDLWQLLVMLTIRKVARKLEHEAARKRGGLQVRGESVFARASSDQQMTIADIVAQPPTPADLDEIEEQCEHLLQQLQTSECREVALLKLQGFTNREVCEQFGRSERWVERKLALIRTTLAGMENDDTL